MVEAPSQDVLGIRGNPSGVEVVLGECQETRLGVHSVRPGGELWVLPSSGRMDDDPGASGVFDAAGRLVRQAQARVPFDRALCDAVMP